MASKDMKKCSTSLLIKDMQVKQHLDFITPQLELAIIEGNNNNK
jgi:hypothetical protein